MNKKNTKITIESLAATVEAGFKRMDEGFKETKKEFKQVRGQMKEDSESLARMVASGFEQTTESIARVEVGQENIQLRVDSLAPQFEVRQLERRVKRLEDKAGIRNQIQK
jgi:hypothetical protein